MLPGAQRYPAHTAAHGYRADGYRRCDHSLRPLPLHKIPCPWLGKRAEGKGKAAAEQGTESVTFYLIFSLERYINFREKRANSIEKCSRTW